MKEENKDEKGPKKSSKASDQANMLKNGILSIIASVFHKIALSSIFVSLGFTTYMISYLHHFQSADEKPLTQQHTYFLMPILSVTMGLGIPFSGIIEFKLGTQRAIILGSIFLISSSAIQYVSHSFYLNLLGIFIFAIGLAVSIVMTGKNACMYFPKKRGMVSGLLALVSAIFSSVLNIFGEKVIINPDSIGPQQGYYLYEVSKNICNFYLFQMGCVGVCTLLCILFIVPFQMKGNMALMKKGMKNNKKKIGPPKGENKNVPKETEKKQDIKEPLLPEDNNENKEEEQKEKEKENEKEENVINNEENKEENKEDNKEDNKGDNTVEGQDLKKEEKKEIDENKPIEVKETNKKEDEIEEDNEKKGNVETIPYDLGGHENSMLNASANYSMNQVKSAAKSFRVWRLFLMGVFAAPLNNFLMITWRPISIFKEMDTNKIQKVNSYSSMVQMIVTPIFGYLADKVPFRVVKIILGLINCAVGFLFYYSFDNVNFFILLLLLNKFAYQGMFTFNEPHFMKVFGMKHFIEISGIIGLAGVIMGPICSLFAFFIESNFRENLDVVYKYMFMISSILYIGDISLSAFETEEPLNV